MDSKKYYHDLHALLHCKVFQHFQNGSHMKIPDYIKSQEMYMQLIYTDYSSRPFGVGGFGHIRR